MKDKSNKRPKILIVDDDKFLLDMYTIKFKEQGFDVTSAFGSTNALTILKDLKEKNDKNSFDVILTDVVMPSMDGFEFVEEIKKNHLAEGAKIIILSNLGQPTDIEKGKRVGADGYIVKADSIPSEVVEKVVGILNSNT